MPDAVAGGRLPDPVRPGSRTTDSVAQLAGRLAYLLRPGDGVIWSQGAATPAPLLQALTEVRERATGGSVMLSIGVGPTIDPQVADHLHLTGLGALGSTRALADADVLDTVPVHLSQLPDLIRRRDVPVDVLLVQVSRPGPDGTHSLGLDAGYVPAALEQARVVVAEVNEHVPWTRGHTPVPTERFDLILQTDRPLAELHRTPPTEIERRIAANAVDLVPDGATLQFGIGSAPAAVAALLASGSGFGLHTGLLDDPQMELLRSGAAGARPHPLARGRAVTATVAGTSRLYREVSDAEVLVRALEHTHALRTLVRIPKLTAINSAVQVDLLGQVNTERVAGRQIGGLGGLGDFLRGAQNAEGGRSILVLPSTAGDGRHSRIVPRVDGGVATVARSDVDAVVTEHGVAVLRGASESVRSARLLAVAAPEHRDGLQRAMS